MADINPDHDANVLNLPNIVTKSSIVVKFIFLQGINHQRNAIHNIFIIFRVSVEGCMKFSKITIRKPLIYQLNDIITPMNTEDKV